MSASYSIYELKGFSRRYAQHEVKSSSSDSTEKVIGLTDATRQWLVYFHGTSMETRAQQAANPPPPGEIPDLPTIGSAHPLDSSVKLKSYDIIDNRDGSVTYKASYEYQAPESSSDRPSQEEGVKNEGNDSGWASVRYFTRAQFSSSGEPLILPTGEPFETLPKIISIGLSYTSIKTYETIPSDLLFANGAINAAPVTVAGYSVGTHCGLLKIRAVPFMEGETRKWKVWITIEIRKTPAKLTPSDGVTDIGHDIALLLVGTRFKPSVTEPAVMSSLLDVDGRSETIKAARILLLPNGKKLTDSSSSSSGSTEREAYYKRVSIYPESIFSASWFND